VVGWSSLRYFWTPRAPEQAARDLARVVDHYSEAWGRPSVVLIGYSFGADVLPFLAARLPEATVAKVRSVVLLGLSRNATFEFHVTGWIGGDGDSRYPTRPEIAKLRTPVVCVVGEDEPDSACHGLPSRQVITVRGGHHFGGDYDGLAERILAQVASEPR
jgi:type IV secretory pathway VirJ component